jgi:hypothetical protein
MEWTSARIEHVYLKNMPGGEGEQGRIIPLDAKRLSL